MKILKIDKSKSIPGFANPKCYARALGGCCRQMSGEHPVSRALLKRVDQELGDLSNEVEVRNLAFQPRDVPQRFGVGSLESKILCTHHNNGLSSYDSEVLRAFDAFEKMHYAAAGRPVVVQSLYTVDGDRFERFLLKALCGGVYSRIFPVEEIARFKDVEPPFDWLEILYRQKLFPDGHGLYCAMPGPGKALTADRTIIKWAPLMLEGEELISVHGLRFWLFGFEFTLLARGPEPKAVDALRRQAYRPNGFTVMGPGVRIRFVWKTGPGSTGIVVGRI